MSPSPIAPLNPMPLPPPFDPAADLLVTGHDLDDEIVLLQACLEFRVAPRRMFEELRRAEQDDRQFEFCQRHGFLRYAHSRADPSRAGHFPSSARAVRNGRFCNNSLGLGTAWQSFRGTRHRPRNADLAAHDIRHFARPAGEEQPHIVDDQRHDEVLVFSNT